jgi:hypothetical protein
MTTETQCIVVIVSVVRHLRPAVGSDFWDQDAKVNERYNTLVHRLQYTYMLLQGKFRWISLKAATDNMQQNTPVSKHSSRRSASD